MSEISEQELLAQAQLGRSADELLREPLIERWFQDTQAAVLGMFAEGPREDAGHWHDVLQNMKRLRDTMDVYMRTGAIAAERLRANRSAIERVSQWKWRKRA